MYKYSTFHISSLFMKENTCRYSFTNSFQWKPTILYTVLIVYETTTTIQWKKSTGYKL